MQHRQPPLTLTLTRTRNLNPSPNPNPPTPTTMNRQFDHEKLEVYKESIAFIAWLEPLLRTLPRSFAVREQLDRASTSIPLNLAEGNGKFTSADRCRYFDISRGSTLECAAALDVLVAKGLCEPTAVLPGKERLLKVVAMLVGLIKTNSDYRLHEGGGE